MQTQPGARHHTPAAGETLHEPLPRRYRTEVPANVVCDRVQECEEKGASEQYVADQMQR